MDPPGAHMNPQLHPPMGHHHACQSPETAVLKLHCPQMSFLRRYRCQVPQDPSGFIDTDVVVIVIVCLFPRDWALLYNPRWPCTQVLLLQPLSAGRTGLSHPPHLVFMVTRRHSPEAKHLETFYLVKRKQRSYYQW